MANTYLAADFGGGSGRVIAGTIIDGKLELEEIHRFINRQIKLGKHLYWDFPFLFEEMKKGFSMAARKGFHVKSIGVDTWGVDFGLIDREGNLLNNPVCYRDARTDGMPEEVFARIDRKKHYLSTGIQVMPINTLFQLYSMKKDNNASLQVAEKLLFMPDLFSFFLTGIPGNEYCIASTSELLHAKKRSWDKDLIRSLGLPEHLFGEIIKPGSFRGKLLSEIASETGLGDNIQVIAVGSHDTASAVVAIPSVKKHIAFLSSGTWSLFGTEIAEPILTDKAHSYGFTNEGGVGGTIRFLQNITGLWIFQQLMGEWKMRGEEVSYQEILSQAEQTEIDSFIQVDQDEFLHPVSMEQAIIKYCLKHHQSAPETKAQFVRCVIQSLASRYRQALEQLNECLPHPIEQLHIIGGGSQNKLLNQLTADYLRIPVYSGPVEATAIGNILVQALADKEIDSIEELKEIAIRSTEPQIYYPTNYNVS